MDKLCYAQTMEYYSMLKRNELPSHEEIPKNITCINILLSERSQSEKATYYIIPTTWYSGEGKAMETNSGGKGLERGDK